jgi:hypothetical protein
VLVLLSVWALGWGSVLAWMAVAEARSAAKKCSAKAMGSCLEKEMGSVKARDWRKDSAKGLGRGSR